MDIVLSEAAFERFLEGLYERDDRLERRAAGGHHPPDEQVDAYRFSAHVEALHTRELDGELWETLEDLDLQAQDEAQAWQAIKDWYLARGCLLLRVGEDEYLLSEALASRLGLTGAGLRSSG